MPLRCHKKCKSTFAKFRQKSFLFGKFCKECVEMWTKTAFFVDKLLFFYKNANPIPIGKLMRFILLSRTIKAFQSGNSIHNVVNGQIMPCIIFFCLTTTHLIVLLKNTTPRCKNVQDFAQNPYTTEQFVQNSPLKGIKHTQTDHKASKRAYNSYKYYGNPQPIGTNKQKEVCTKTYVKKQKSSLNQCRAQQYNV